MARRRAPLAAGLIGAGVLLGAWALGWVVTPHDHVAGGCFWWTAKAPGDIAGGDSGCVRGYVFRGGLGESQDPGSARLNYDDITYRGCGWKPGDAVVARYRAVVDDGRVILYIIDCR